MSLAFTAAALLALKTSHHRVVAAMVFFFVLQRILQLCPTIHWGLVTSIHLAFRCCAFWLAMITLTDFDLSRDHNTFVLMTVSYFLHAYTLW
jgi:hypothetical protein